LIENRSPKASALLAEALWIFPIIAALISGSIVSFRLPNIANFAECGTGARDM